MIPGTEDAGAALPGFPLLSDQEQLSAYSNLWHLLAKRVKRYTMDETSSVPVETAQELLASICFTLGLSLQETGAPPQQLASAPLDPLFLHGLEVLETEIEKGKRLWNDACQSLPKIRSISLWDTMQGIGMFFKRYDFRFLAHEIPCDIDYQLCQPVPESYLGIIYINEYLHRILLENKILVCYHHAQTTRLLEQSFPGYQELLLNLCQPVLENAVGLALLGRDPLSLILHKKDIAELESLLMPLSPKHLEDALSNAGTCCFGAWEIKDARSKTDLLKSACDLAPRIKAALPHGNLDGIFHPLLG